MDAGVFLGVIDVLPDPWVWVYGLENYVYVPESHETESGAWVYIPQ